jgi:hypothetical protein
MPKSKNRKDHKKKARARSLRISQDKKRVEKQQREMIMKLIEQEKQKGLFENLPQINPSEGPQIDLTSGPIV